MHHPYESQWQVDLSNNDIGSEGAKPLAEAIAVSASLTSVSLRGNSLGDAGVEVVCNAVQSNEHSKLASLDLATNGCGPDGAKAVTAMMAVTGSLTEVCQIRKAMRTRNLSY